MDKLPPHLLRRAGGTHKVQACRTSRQKIPRELQEIFARHGAGAALSAKAVFKPNKEFHTARHTLFSAEQNLEIDKVVPVSASVKTKLGRGGSYED
jgi:hypothetical protein